MLRVSIIVVIVVGLLAACFVTAPRLMLHFAKERAIKKYADGKWGQKMLNTVPKSPPQKLVPTVDYATTAWMSVADTDCALGFPSDRFAQDSNPKRENAVIHHARYRVLVLAGASAKQFAPVMKPLGFTNLYDFVRSVFYATEREISQQPSMDALQRHQVLLDAKTMLAPVCFDDSCIEFARDDLRGFVVGDPARTKNLYVLIYVESQQQFIDLGVIQETPIQLSDLEELICVLKARSNKTTGANAGGPGRLPVRTSWPARIAQFSR